MSADELLALRTGTLIRWTDIELDAVVAVNEAGELRIRWPDGLDSVITDEDTEVDEFAEALEVAWMPDADEPVVVGIGRSRTATAG